jgi:hypothetical protein
MFNQEKKCHTYVSLFWNHSILYSTPTNITYRIISHTQVNHYMAFQNSGFRLVDKRSVKTRIRTVVRISRIWTGVPDVVYLAGNFACEQKKILLFNFPILIKPTNKNFTQPNSFLLNMFVYRIM